jgi:hypothetical protein
MAAPGLCGMERGSGTPWFYVSGFTSVVLRQRFYVSGFTSAVLRQRFYVSGFTSAVLRQPASAAARTAVAATGLLPTAGSTAN